MTERLTRREFLRIVCSAGLGVVAANQLSRLWCKSDVVAVPTLTNIGYTHEAMFYDRLDEETVRCLLCPHECLLKDGQRSFCRVREPKNGKLFSLVYELVCARHIDPIEKKPIYHVLPGSLAYSIAAAGCNLRCKFCQNWQISQSPPENTRNEFLSTTRLVELARGERCRSIAYTYTEPTVFYEYMFDVAKLAKQDGLKNISVTAGYINPEPLKKLCAYLDAANVDLKAYSDDYLRNVCAQRLTPLLEALKIMHNEGVWVEITNLIVPTMNDDMDMIRDMCVWIRENLGQDTPLHFSRFWPMYKLRDLPPTPEETLRKARNIAMQEGLHYVYIGNVRDYKTNSTYCPSCKKIVVKREGYTITERHIKHSKCTYCGEHLAGIWE